LAIVPRAPNLLLIMSVGEMREINRQYAQKFGNFEKINHPSIAYDVRFATLLKKALETGQIVSRADVDAVIPGVPWEEFEEFE
jgi:hypothetical protein